MAEWRESSEAAVHICVRIFIDGVLQSEKTLWVHAGNVGRLAERHAELTVGAAGLVMVEIEFLDEPDITQRFFRCGTDPRGMVWPVAVGKLGGGE